MDINFEELVNKFVAGGINFAGKLLLGLLIFFVGKWLIKKIIQTLDKLMTKRQIDIALKSF